MDSLNPQVLPSSLPRKDHRKATQVALWAAFAAVILGVSYWALVGQKEVDVTPSSPTVKTEAEMRQEIVRNLKSPTITHEEIKKVIGSLAEAKSGVSAEQRAKIISGLK